MQAAEHEADGRLGVGAAPLEARKGRLEVRPQQLGRVLLQEVRDRAAAAARGANHVVAARPDASW
jgi:hypothetical protein